MCSISLVAIAGGAELVEDAVGVDGVPDDDRVDDDRQTERLLALLVRRALANVSFVGVEDRAAQRMELLAFVELATDAGAELLVGEPRQDEVRLDKASVFLQGLGERVASAAGLEAGEEQ